MCHDLAQFRTADRRIPRASEEIGVELPPRGSKLPPGSRGQRFNPIWRNIRPDRVRVACIAEITDARSRSRRGINPQDSAFFRWYERGTGNQGVNVAGRTNSSAPHFLETNSATLRPIGEIAHDGSYSRCRIDPHHPVKVVDNIGLGLAGDQYLAARF